MRVDHSVLQPEHPLHELFQGDRPHHLLVSTYDGRFIVPVQRAGAKDIWKAMSRVLRKDHRKSPDSAMRGLVKLLSEFDALDDREAALQAQLQTKLERGKESRAQKIEEELTELRKQREALFEREAKLRDLKPHPVIEDEQKG